MVRDDVTFPSGETFCSGWLYRPDTPDTGGTDTDSGDLPVIVMAHGLGGIKEMRLDAFAERFAAAGYICLVFDYRYFGTSGGTPRQWLSIRRQREDWRAAVAAARTLDGADPDRVIVWGTSFGGGHVAVTAAEDPRIAAAVAQCPFTSGLASSLAIPTLTAAKIGVRAVRDLIAAFRHREPVTVAAYGPPGSTALMTAPDVVAGCEAIIPDDYDLDNAITARFGLDIVRDFPGRRFRDVQCPVHITICTGDTVAPAGPSTRYARQAPHGEVAFADANHFGIYVGEAFEENVARQIDFLTRTVPAVPA